MQAPCTRAASRLYHRAAGFRAQFQHLFGPFHSSLLGPNDNTLRAPFSNSSAPLMLYFGWILPAGTMEDVQVLSNVDIWRRLEEGTLRIDPSPGKERFGGAAVDLTLAPELRTFNPSRSPYI